MKENKASGINFQKWIIFVFVLSSVFSILLVGIALNFVLEKTTLENWKKRQEFVTMEFAPQCDFEIEEAKRDLEFLSKIPAFSQLPYVDQIDLSINGIPETSDKEKRELLQKVLEIQKMFNLIFILRKNADLYLIQPYQSQLNSRKYNFADRDYIKETQKTKKTVISNSFIGAGNIPIVVISVPVLDKANEITAYIGGVFYLANLSKLVTKKRIGSFNSGFIVDKKGHLIAHTNPELVQEKFRKQYIKHPLVNSFLASKSNYGSKVRIDDSIDPITKELYLTSFVTLKSGWGLGLAIKKETVISEIRSDIGWITIFVSLIILFVCAIGALFTRSIVKRWVLTEKDLFHKTHDLGERVKELNCLYNISKLVEKSDISLDEIFQGIVNLIPISWRYPSNTCSRVVVNELEYKTEDFSLTSWNQKADIYVHGELYGKLEVCYLEEKPEADEGPFFKEERHLIDEISKRLGTIIERSWAEEELRKRSQVIEQSDSTVVITDVQGNIEYVNPAFSKITGYSFEEAMGKNPRILKSDQHSAKFYKEMWDEISNGKTWRGEMLNKKKNGELFWESASISPVRDPSAKTTHYVSIKDEITLLKKTEQTLKESEEKHRLLFETMEQGVVYQDSKGVIIDANLAAEMVLGLSLDQMQGRTSIDPRWKSIHEDGSDYPGETHPAMMTLKTGKPVKNAIMGVFHPSGEDYKWILINAIPQFKKNEKTPFRVYTTFLDLSQRKQMEAEIIKAKEQAEQSNQAKSTFLASMSHELRTPLNSILGFSQVLKSNKNKALSGKELGHVSHILTSGYHLLDLINDVLDLSNIESGKYDIEITSINIKNIFIESIDLVGSLASNHNVNVKYLNDHLERYIEVDERGIKQVLINLLSNAIKYNKEEGEVVVSCRITDENSAQIEVADTGFGISEDKMDLLFQPFNRLGAESSTIEGTGIGLTITKRLVDLMGGKISVKSELGRGTSFLIQFPLVAKPPNSEEKTETQLTDKSIKREETQNKTVLYFEDNKVNKVLMESILDYYPNLTLMIAENAEDGIEIAQTQIPDLILMDIQMPGMDGFEAMQRLKEMKETSDIPVIAVTAHAMAKDKAKGKEAGFQEYVTKPIQVGQFKKLIEKLVFDK